MLSTVHIEREIATIVCNRNISTRELISFSLCRSYLNGNSMLECGHFSRFVVKKPLPIWRKKNQNLLHLRSVFYSSYQTIQKKIQNFAPPHKLPFNATVNLLIYFRKSNNTSSFSILHSILYELNGMFNNVCVLSTVAFAVVAMVSWYGQNSMYAPIEITNHTHRYICPRLSATKTAHYCWTMQEQRKIYINSLTIWC